MIPFEYPSDVLGDPQWARREHEPFRWFTLIGRAPEDGELETAFDAECA